jgi:hypothetical protein
MDPQAIIDELAIQAPTWKIYDEKKHENLIDDLHWEVGAVWRPKDDVKEQVEMLLDKFENAYKKDRYYKFELQWSTKNKWWFIRLTIFKAK